MRLLCLAASVLFFALTLGAQDASVASNLVTVQARQKEVLDDMAQKWSAFQATLKQATLSPEERIRRVEVWRAAQQPEFDTLATVQKQLAQARREEDVKGLPQSSNQLAVVTDPLLAEVQQIDTEMVTALDQLRQIKANPAQRIAWVDELLTLNQDVLVERDRLRAEWMQQQKAKVPPATAIPSTTGTQEPQQSRRDLLVQEIRQIVAGTRGLALAARIAALDAARGELEQRQQELQRLQLQLTPAPPAPVLRKK